VSVNRPKPPTSRKPDTVAATQRESPVRPHHSGRVKHDERGNAIWEWAVNTGGVARDSVTNRLQKLENSSLSLAEEVPPAQAPLGFIKENRQGTAHGYSPYDSGILAKKEVSRKKDLRKLSEWLKLKKQAQNREPDE